ncbi:MAG: adenylosuccinate lyase [Chloroflexota bacterium]
MIPRYSNPEMARVWSDEHKMEVWLRVEIAACEAWAAAGTIPESDMVQIREATFDMARWDELYRETHHDVIAFIRTVSERIGPAGRWIHYGMTSQDVWDTSTCMQMMEAAELLERDLDALETAVTTLAVRYKDTPEIGRTHGVHAEPTTFGHKLTVWIDQHRLNRQRMRRAREEISIGMFSGAVGTHANVPPEIEEHACAILNLTPAPASSQIIQRDRHAAYMTALAVVAATLEQQALEIRLLQRTEVSEVAEPFGAGQQGSSAMPHKRNPELVERICGLARVVRANAIPALENVALWHERDISHSSVERIILPDSCIALDYIIQMFTGIVRDLDVYPEQMRANLESTRGLIYSGRVLIALVEAGMQRNDAYQLIQSYAKRVWAGDGDLQTHLTTDPKVRELLNTDTVSELFSLDYHLRHIDVPFKRLGLL